MFLELQMIMIKDSEKLKEKISNSLFFCLLEIVNLLFLPSQNGAP